MIQPPNGVAIDSVHRRRSRRRAMPSAFRRSAAGILWIGFVWLGGCASQGELSRTSSGLAGGDAERLSLIVAQTRAQFPELSAGGLRQGVRAAAESPPGGQPALALRGEGRGLRPGIQVGPVQRVALGLYLDKRGYDTGFVRLSLDGAPEEQWRVVAHELRGEPDADFELILALADGNARLRYLVVLGGEYEEGEARFRAFEGTLVIPGPSLRIEQWERIFKIDFGYRYPATPLFWNEVNRADGLYADLLRDQRRLQAGRKRNERERSGLEGLMADPQADRGEVARRRDELAAAEAEQSRAAEVARDRLIRYYRLRGALASHFAEHVDSNPYRWLDADGQQSHYDHWKQVELHHPRIDAVQEALQTYLQDPGPLERAKAEAFAVVDRHNNWAKDPSRPAGGEIP